MTIKQRLKLELYGALLNMDLEKMTENEATLIHHLAIDDETTDALTKRARRDYATMCRAAKLKPKTYKAVTALVRGGRLYLQKKALDTH